MNNEKQSEKGNGRGSHEVTFTIDGREFTVTDRSQTAADLLRLAGLDPGGYDLGELHGHNPTPHRYGDDERVQVQNNDRFVSIRESATVA